MVTNVSGTELRGVEMSNDDHLADIAQQIAVCTKCELCAKRNNTVPGEGNPEADVLFIGEGPGRDEDEEGRPFIGRAGELLTKALEEKAGVSRDEVFITNIVKCRPPENRNPLFDEMNVCSPFLFEQVNIIQPKVVVILGKVAAEHLLQRPVKITKENGNFEFLSSGLCVMTVLHPSYVLRNKTPEVEASFFDAIINAFSLAYPSPGGEVA